MHDYGIKTASIVYIVMTDFMKEETNHMKDKKNNVFRSIFCAKQNELDEH